MTELTAAVGREQIRQLPEQVSRVQEHAEVLRKRLSEVEVVTVPQPETGRSHSYYLFPMIFEESAFDGDFDAFLEAVRGEGVPVGRYVRPIYTLPLFEEKTVHDNGQVYDGDLPNASAVSFSTCPTADRLHQQRLLITDAVMPGMTSEDVEDIYRAIKKVEHHLGTK
jgi:dTDP-4-amino-4,6-dideoxygalactose transaminase